MCSTEKRKLVKVLELFEVKYMVRCLHFWLNYPSNNITTDEHIIFLKIWMKCKRHFCFFKVQCLFFFYFFNSIMFATCTWIHLQFNTKMLWAAVREFRIPADDLWIFISCAVYTENEHLHSTVNWSIASLWNKISWKHLFVCFCAF